jgi:hypothetical protein
MEENEMVEGLHGGEYRRSGGRDTSHGYSIRRSTQADDPRYPRPDSVYLIYIGFDEHRRMDVRHYHTDFEDGEVTAAESALVAQARAGSAPLGRNFRDLVWREACYLTVVIDAPGWQFSWGRGDVGDPIIFLGQKDFSEAAISQRRFYDPNYSFLDAVAVDAAGANGVRCINHFKQDAEGIAIGPGQARRYCFEIYIEVPFASEPERISVVIDPDGQNQGPD